MKDYTVSDIYKEFLSSIKKDYIGTVTPEQFNIAMRDGGLLLNNYILGSMVNDSVYKSYLSQLKDVYGKQYSDGKYLEVNSLHVLSTHGGQRIADGEFQISNPTYENAINKSNDEYLCTNWVLLPSLNDNNQPEGVRYQAAIEIDSIYVSYDDSTAKVRCSPLATDRKDVLNNTFTMPNERKCYYTINGSSISIYVPQTVSAIKLYISYTKRPFVTFFDRSNPADASFPYKAIQQGSYIYPYVSGYGSINPRIPYSLIPLLISYSVRSYLSYIQQVKI
jgi:hypothetical protein